MEIVLNNKPYELNLFTGQVLSEKTWTETAVSGSGGGGGGYSYQGTGFSITNPVKIASATLTHQQFFLRDSLGHENAFTFSNMNLAVREGSLVSVAWGIKKGKTQGPYWMVYNHDTNDIRFTDAFRKVFDPQPLIEIVTMIAGAWFGYSVLASWFIDIWNGLVHYNYVDYSYSGNWLLVAIALIVAPFLAVIAERFFYYRRPGNLRFKQFQNNSQKLKDIVKLLRP